MKPDNKIRLTFKLIGTFILSVVAGITYRMGGSGNFPRWARHVGLSTCMAATMLILGYFHWTILIAYGAIYGLSTTYFKKKGTDAKWYHWMFVGLAFSLSVLPVVLVYHNWLGFGLRTVICTALVTIWSEINDNAVWEEIGRGAIPIITLPLLLL